jgi:hypothetical protein
MNRIVAAILFVIAFSAQAGLETGTYIGDLVSTNPPGSDPRSQGADHLRLIKSTVQATFPGMSGRAFRAQSKGSTYTVLTTDNLSVIKATAAITVNFTASATLGNGYTAQVWASNGAVSVVPNGVETINGAASLSIPSGLIATVWSDGSNLFSTMPMPTGYGRVFMTAAVDNDITALLQMGTGDAGATTRTAIALRNGGYSAPVDAGSRADGDKLVFWNNISVLKTAIGLNDHTMWFQNHSAAGSALNSFQWHGGQAAASVEMMRLQGPVNQRELLLNTTTLLSIAGYSGYRANGSTGSFYDAMSAGTRIGSLYTDGGRIGVGTIANFPIEFFTGGTTNVQAKIGYVASAANYIVLHGRAAGNFPVIGANGSDTNVSIYYVSKGTGSHSFYTAGAFDSGQQATAATEQFRVIDTVGATRLITVTGSNGGNPTIGVNAGGLTITPATTLSAALTYGGVTLSNAVTGTGSMVLSADAALTGNPTATTQAVGNNSTRLATTAFVSAFLQQINNSIGADVLLNNTANYFDGPSVAQGTSGTWFASGTVTLIDTNLAANFSAKLWDGTTVISSAYTSTSQANGATTLSLSGYISSPAGNIRISARGVSSTTSKILFNQSGNSKDSTITAFKVSN